MNGYFHQASDATTSIAFQILVVVAIKEMHHSKIQINMLEVEEVSTSNT